MSGDLCVDGWTFPEAGDQEDGWFFHCKVSGCVSVFWTLLFYQKVWKMLVYASKGVSDILICLVLSLMKDP